jgi:hypothetical protein
MRPAPAVNPLEQSIARVLFSTLGSENIHYLLSWNARAKRPPPVTMIRKYQRSDYERQVLVGGPKCLSNSWAFRGNLPFIHLYQGTWRHHRVEHVEVDCAFFRRPSEG